MPFLTTTLFKILTFKFAWSFYLIDLEEYWRHCLLSISSVLKIKAIIEKS
jgi:hypothetical protein